MNIIDLMAFIGSFSFNIIQAVNPILISKDMTKISPKITLSNELRWPKNGYKLSVSLICSSFGSFASVFFIVYEALIFTGASNTIFISTFILGIANMTTGKLSNHKFSI